MEILKRGVDPRTIPLKASCNNCGTFVQFSKAEATYHTAYDQRESEYWSIPCPVCSSSISATGPSSGMGRYE